MISTVACKYRDFLNRFPNNEGKQAFEKTMTFWKDENGNPGPEQSNPELETQAWSIVSWSNLTEETRYIYEKYQTMVKALAD